MFVREVCASALFICLGGRVEDAHSCEIVPCLAMRQYVKKTEKVSADSPRGRHDCREEQVAARVVVVLVVVELLFDGGIERTVDVGV